MKTKRFFNTLAASVMLAATAGLMTACVANDDNPISPDDVINNQWGNPEMTFKVGSAGVKVKKVEGGTYSMKYEDIDDRTRNVTGTLSDFYIAPVEVTNKLWSIVMGSKPQGQTNDGDEYPVTMVSYEDITKKGGFLDKLNEMMKDQLTADKKFVLPTEAQWHYAAMGGQKSGGFTYAGSNTISDVAWYKDNSDGATHPIASKQPNELGLYDMTGNVSEWCYDHWYDTQWLPKEQGLNFTGYTFGNGYVFCGGGWNEESGYCSVMFRSNGSEDKAANSLGFRLAIASVAQNTAYRCGDNLIWSYDEGTKILTIEGTGDFYSFTNTGTPWQSLEAESIVLQPGVTSIGNRTFAGMRKATSVSLPNTLTSIGQYAFSDCSELPSIVIPSSVTSISTEAFPSCNKLTSLIVEAGNPKYDSRDNCNAVIETATNTLVHGCAGTVIPNSVTTIGPMAFRNVRGFTSITVPGNVTTIGNEAFRWSSLKEVTIQEGVKTIGARAFGLCGIVSINIPASVTSIGEGAFERCFKNESLITVDAGNTVYDSRNNCNAIIETATNTLIRGCSTTVIPNDITAIADYGFSSSQMTSIDIPASVNKIGKHTFNGCSKLASIDIPASVTSIGVGAFDSCEKLSSINLPNGITAINDSTFHNCRSMKSIIIPSSVTSIGEYVFYYCGKIKNLYCYAVEPPTSAEFTFPGLSYDVIIHVPEASVDAYKTSDGWKEFENIVALTDEDPKPVGL